MRLFIAIPVSLSISKELENWVADHKIELPFRKWTHPRDYHITLQFIGDISATQCEELTIALKKIKANAISLGWSGIGTFGQPTAPRVLWGAVNGDLEGLSSLQEKVVKATTALGFVPEDRPYSPHITIARGFAGDNDMPMEPSNSSPSSKTWESDYFVLMRTHMHEAPMYEIISSFPLIKHE